MRNETMTSATAGDHIWFKDANGREITGIIKSISRNGTAVTVELPMGETRTVASDTKILRF